MPPPPGKPVTFYECHPEDHAPAPSVRADFHHGNSMEAPLHIQQRVKSTATPPWSEEKCFVFFSSK